MGAKTKLEIETDQLNSAAGKAGETLAASTIPPIPAPPPTATSQLDAALALISTQSETLRTSVDTLDMTWATKQQAALTESPPVLQEQDVQGAQDYERSSQFPMPEVRAPGGASSPGGVQPAGFTPSVPEGPWGLDDFDGDFDLDPWGNPALPVPVAPDMGGAAPGPGASGGVAPL